MDRRIAFLKNLLLQDLKLQYSIRAMANLINVSPQYLHKLFKKELGTSPSQFIKQLKLERASELLLTTFKSIKEVAVEVGIPDQSNFVKSFKIKFGSTPTNFIKKHSDKDYPSNKSEK